MSKNPPHSQTVDDEVETILVNHGISPNHKDLERLVNTLEQLISKREVEARIDELDKLSTNTNPAYYVLEYIDRRRATLSQSKSED